LVAFEPEEGIDDVQLDPETPEIHDSIRRLLYEHAEVITDVPKRTNLAECTIQLEHDRPVRTRQYPLPFSQREKIKEEVDGLLKMGVVEPSSSPYSSPIVLVAKKDGNTRFCIDFRKLNKIVVFDSEPMPDPEYLFAKIGWAKFFSKIDLSKGYYQIPMSEEDKAKTAFSTPQGSFQWTVMPFGLKTAGAIFSRMMRKLLRPLDPKEVDNFMDDILVATETLEQHIECLDQLFCRLKEASLSARPSKCFLGFQEIEYLGHVIGHGRIRPMEEKLEKLRNLPRPTTKKQIRAFLGLAGFYRKFVEDFATVALPLTDATKKGKPNEVEWNEELESAFEEIKRRLCSEPVCILPDLDKPFVLIRCV